MKIFNKNEWKKVKLGDICDLRNGVAIKSEDYVTSSNTLNCRMSNIRPDGTFDILYNAKYLPDNFLEKYKNYLLKDGDLVIAMTDMAGDPKILGVPTVVKSNGFNIIQNQRVGKLELLTKNIDENYLKLVLQSKKAKNYFKKFSAGGVQLNLSKKEILNVPIILPTIEEQKKLANLFKIIENFIYLRKEELVNLHFLNKSLFSRMFGDIKTNDKNWEIKKLGEVVQTQYGTSKKATSVVGEFPILRMNNITYSGEMDYKDLKYIELSDSEKEKFLLKKGELLFNRTNSKELVGKTGLFNLDIPMAFAGYLIRIKPSNLIHSKFLLFFMNSEFMKKLLYNKAKNIVGMANINAKELEDFSIILPPIELQNKFAERIEKIEKLSFTSKKLSIFRDFKALYKKVSA
ncbi:restriction endonuclease subunit S [Fusobacterium periodonticum]|uniref:restriction endonuclease subunit S n=1 Tax=Fusobacterium periodonticum TaxID=860 RepID=UPI00195C2FF0|nr:restriction endonuclease subunit S [Fusobacterium periodonticum]VTX87902.1 Type-1 restriction enzyme EcoKI specificity protein [Fusobacterium periodonticum]